MSATKFQHTKSYFSSRLLAKLEAALSAPVTLLEAPAGYGKTTALKCIEELCEGQAQAHWYVALHEDAHYAWERLCQTLARFDPLTGVSLLAQELPNRADSHQAVQKLRQLQCGKETLLILDKFQNLQKELRDLLTVALFQTACPRLHVIISTQYLRTPKEVDEDYYSVNRIGTDDLMLGLEDILAYYAREGRTIGPAQAEALFRRTEGWPVAISLCLHGEAEICACREDYRVDSLLADAYFDRLTTQEQEILLPFALFDAVAEGQLSQMSGLPVSSKYKELIHRTPLIRYDAAAGVYYPILF